MLTSRTSCTLAWTIVMSMFISFTVAGYKLICYIYFSQMARVFLAKIGMLHIRWSMFIPAAMVEACNLSLASKSPMICVPDGVRWITLLCCLGSLSNCQLRGPYAAINNIKYAYSSYICSFEYAYRMILTVQDSMTKTKATGSRYRTPHAFIGFNLTL